MHSQVHATANPRGTCTSTRAGKGSPLPGSGILQGNGSRHCLHCNTHATVLACIMASQCAQCSMAQICLLATFAGFDSRQLHDRDQPHSSKSPFHMQRSAWQEARCMLDPLLNASNPSLLDRLVPAWGVHLFLAV
eukprot:1159597-Pelagomonas_calceolata.AAC.6